MRYNKDIYTVNKTWHNLNYIILFTAKPYDIEFLWGTANAISVPCGPPQGGALSFLAAGASVVSPEGWKCHRFLRMA